MANKLQEELNSLIDQAAEVNELVLEFKKEAMDDDGNMKDEIMLEAWKLAMKVCNNLAYKIDALSEEIFQAKERENG